VTDGVKNGPHDHTRGWLRNGNPPGDYSQAPRCGARNRRGGACGCPAMANGRCRLHGGLSTGPKTAEGIERIRQAVTKHGFYTRAEKELRERRRAFLRGSHAFLKELSSAEAEKEFLPDE
jgi:hypothetical protein